MGRPHLRGFGGRPYQGQVAEVVHFRDPGEGCRHAQVGRQMEPGLLLGKEPEASTTLEHRQECAGVDPSGDAQRTTDGTERC